MSPRPEPHPAPPQAEPAPDWQRLSARVVWVDIAQSALSLSPALIAIVFFDADPRSGAMIPFAILAVLGVTGAIADLTRWRFTRFRITETEILRRTGVFVRRTRSVRRDRIRNVDISAKLRHRLAGLRVVSLGAGQQAGAGERALSLDALSRRDAEELRREVLRKSTQAAPDPAPSRPAESAAREAGPTGTAEPAQVLATLRPSWVLYNAFSVWSYLTAAGFLWGSTWFAGTFGVDLLALAKRAFRWDTLGWPGITALLLVGGGLLGALGMAARFIVQKWNFELTRVRDGDRSLLRTRHGLLSTHEVNRDEARVRGISLSEPLFWRWIGLTDTALITTGLRLWDPQLPSAIIPRGPKSAATRAATHVLGEPSPLSTALRQHPPAARRRRLWWATLTAVLVAAALAVPVAAGAAPAGALWAALGLWPVALGAALISYRALGHAIAGRYLVVRSGATTRTTSALRRDAISTIAVRQSLLQQRLGLSTVSAMTAAGWFIYEAIDVASEDAVALADAAAPGLLADFLLPTRARRAP